jgi:hypothetical protein
MARAALDAVIGWEVPPTGEKENQGLHATGLALRPICLRGETVGKMSTPVAMERSLELNGPEYREADA